MSIGIAIGTDGRAQPSEGLLVTGILGLAVLLGLVVRVWMIATGSRDLYAVDELFDRLGWNLASGAGFSLDGRSPSAHVGPGYPGLLAGFYLLVGHRVDLVPYLHVALDIGTAACVWGAARLLFGPMVGALAAAAVFLYPAYWTYDLRVRSESVLTLLVSAWVLAMVLAQRAESAWIYGLGGLVAGAAMLVKPVVGPTVLLATALAWVSSPPGRSHGRRAAAVLLCAALVVVPWTIRNLSVFGTWLPVSAGAGTGLWMGSDPVSRGSWPMSQAREAQIWEVAGLTPLAYPHVMYEVEVDRELGRKGWTRIQADPGRYLWLTAQRAVEFWVGNALYLVGSETGFTDGFSTDVQRRGMAVATYSLFKRLVLVPGLAVLAIAIAWAERRRWRELAPLVLLPLGLMAGYAPFCVEAGRYALPVLPCVMILAVAFVWRVRTKVVPARS